MSEISMRGRRKKGKVGGGREKRESGKKGRESLFPFLPQSPFLFLFLPIFYPLYRYAYVADESTLK